MDKRQVEEHFMGGLVIEEFAANRILIFLVRSFFVVLGIWALYHAQNTQYMANKVVAYMLLVFALWRIYRQGQPLIYLCEDGLVVRRRALTMAESVAAYLNDDRFYIYIGYQKVIGFSERWQAIHIGAMRDGGVYVVPIDLQYINYKDKQKILAFIKNWQDKKSLQD